MDAPTFDLQAHSAHSDGSLPPAGVVAHAAAAGVQLLALTDHDTVDGVAEAVAAGRALGVGVVSGVEISAREGPHEDLHLLGYGMDVSDPRLGAALAAFREDRVVRARRMAESLRGLGWALDTAGLRGRREAGQSLGRPHLAAAVAAHPANAARMRDEGLRTATDVLVAYLIPGTPAYHPRERPGVREAIDVVHAAGGVAVWAHPFWDVEDPRSVAAMLERFAAMGLDGVEAFYATHDREQTHAVADEAERLGLLTTGSADFHGPEHPVFSRFRAFATFGREPRLGPIGAKPRPGPSGGATP